MLLHQTGHAMQKSTIISLKAKNNKLKSDLGFIIKSFSSNSTINKKARIIWWAICSFVGYILAELAH
jgi:hypothetical protein